MRTKSLVVAMVVWVSVVAAASGVTWLVIDSAGQDLMTVDTPVATSVKPSPTLSGTRLPRAKPSPSRSSKAPSRSAAPSRSVEPSTPSSPTTTPAPAQSTTSSPQAPRSSTGDDPQPPPRPTSRSDAWTGAPGTVAITCTRSRITGRFVTPNDGWHAEVEGSEGGRLKVKFESGERETQVEVRCVGGVPRFRVGAEEEE